MALQSLPIGHRCNFVLTNHFFQGDVNISIIVQISFHGGDHEQLQTFPIGSCFRLAVEDSSYLDAPSVIHYEKYIDLSNRSINKTYVIKTWRPRVFDDSFHVVGVLNVGWCAKGDLNNWIRIGDYMEEPRCSLQKTDEGEFVGRLQLKKYKE